MKTKIVHNVIELISSIASDTTIILKNNIYNVSNLLIEKNDNIYNEKVFDGSQLIIDNVSNLIIKGEDNNCVQILAQPRYANVITFRNCTNITVESLTLGHTTAKGYCVGGVLKFENCKVINIIKDILFGCGTEGITLDNTENVKVDSSVIKECTYGIMSIRNSSSINFASCNFFKNMCYYSFNIYDSYNILFENCNIYNNVSLEERDMFNKINNDSKFVNCNIYDNLDNSKSKDEEMSNNKFSPNQKCVISNDDFTQFVKIDENTVLLYEDHTKILLRKNDVDLIINEELPSNPQLSPDKTKITYISPHEWEVIGSLYLYNVVSAEHTILMKVEEIKDKNRIKKAIWLNDNNLILIIGHAYGTVSIGGDIYTFNINSKKLVSYFKCDKKEQITDINISNNQLKYDIITYDDDFTDYTLKTNCVPIKCVIDKLEESK